MLSNILEDAYLKFLALIMLITILSIASCGPSAEEKAHIKAEAAKEAANKDVTVLDNNGNKYVIIVIDECQYIQGRDCGGNPLFAHKGNCDNPEHLKQQ